VFYGLARPWLFALDPEVAHDLSFAALERAHRLGLTRILLPHVADDPVKAMGLTFRNPVGLAAGLDKNAEHIDALASFGFGFIEAGTVTPQPQPGNDKPRMFRIPAAKALINRLGFNNQGVAAFVANVARQQGFSAAGGVIGLNIGKNASTLIDRAQDDYVTCLDAVYPVAVERPTYVTVNISSPNTKNLRELQGDRELMALLRGLADARKRLADRFGQRVPMAVKIAPDLENDALPRIADIMVKHGMDAIIATNTTLARDAVGGMRHARESGGLSGAPLRGRSTAVVRRLTQHLRGALPVIAVGGILSGADAVEKLQAGATLVQIYTGLVYRGPQLVGECRKAILQWRSGRR
jgi:dihydroorotate dehydrogenase